MIFWDILNSNFGPFDDTTDTLKLGKYHGRFMCKSGISLKVNEKNRFQPAKRTCMQVQNGRGGKRLEELTSPVC